MDVLREYYSVAGVDLIAGVLDFDTINLMGEETGAPNDEGCALVSIGFVPIGYADSDMQLLYMYLGGIDYFGLKFRTDEGRLEVLEEFYPQIIAVLKEMPDSCLNLKAVVRSVRNFELTFDYSQLHDFDRRGDLEAAIEAYIRQLSAEALR